MKGLLLKDWYMVWKYCKYYFLLGIVFFAFSIVEDNMFFVFYPCLLCGIIPANLLGYDERSRWMQYSGTLPYTRAQIVSAKYLIGLFAQTAMLFLMGIARGIRMGMNGSFRGNDFLVIMLLLLIAEGPCGCDRPGAGADHLHCHFLHQPSLYVPAGCGKGTGRVLCAGRSDLRHQRYDDRTVPRTVPDGDTAESGSGASGSCRSGDIRAVVVSVGCILPETGVVILLVL